MLFNSFEFLIFYLIVISLYFIFPHKRFRWMLLLLSSYIFYMWWNPVYILLILFSTGVDYCAGILMERHQDDTKLKRLFLISSLTANLGLLFVFKYFNYMGRLITAYTPYGSDLFSFDLLLPMGISFYTFQTLSYTIDVYRGRIKAEKHFGYFALYVSFFPQLVAGPIERSNRLIPQLKQTHVFDYDRMREGLLIMGYGFFKKMVIADRAAIFVNSVYGQAGQIHDGWEFIMATGLFIIQIYGDFSGYSDIAIGSAKIMGIDLMENFKQPFFSRGFKAFWGKWHISLMGWFQDYLYIPLGGSRKGVLRTYFNVMMVFVVSGIWHGANLTFLIWGFLNGLFLLMEVLWERMRIRWLMVKEESRQSPLKSLFQMGLTISTIGSTMVFFRATSVREALSIYSKIPILSFDRLYTLQGGFDRRFFTYGLGVLEMKLLIGGILVMFMIDAAISRRGGVGAFVEEIRCKPIHLRWAIYYLMIFTIIIFGLYGPGEIQEFIYFQF
jgi:D-alanyl-lipoteichoic acid acyltransferase DltB (MBOAT superfamily)